MSFNYVGKICPYCQYPFKSNSDVIVCTLCKIPHHRTCWEDNRSCTTFGCTGKPGDIPNSTRFNNQTDNSFSSSINYQDSNQSVGRTINSPPSGSSPVGLIANIISPVISIAIVIIFLAMLALGSSYSLNGLLIVGGIVALLLGIAGLALRGPGKIFPIIGILISIGIIIIAYSNNQPIRDDYVASHSQSAVPVDMLETDSSISVPRDYLTIQEAIDSAYSGQTIIVYEGHYKENINFFGKDIILMSRDPADPVVVSNTVLDGSGRGTVVTFNHGESRNAVLSGFTITGGTGSREKYTITSYDGSRMNFDRCYGGGVLITDNSNPTIANNHITGNTTKNISQSVLGVGAGIAVLNGSSPLIDNNIVSGNSTDAYGGGIAVWYKSAPVIVNNIIENNRANEIGGGILVTMMCNPEIANNIISGNHSSDWSGGIFIAHMSIANITANSITHNTAVDGAGIFVRRAESVSIVDNEISDNRAGRNGGAIYIDNQAIVSVENNTIARNTAKNGGAIWLDSDSRVRLTSPDNNRYESNSPNNITRR